MACPLTVSKFVGTISLGLLTVSILGFTVTEHTSGLGITVFNVLHMEDAN